MKQLFLTIILLGFAFLSFAIEHNIKPANGETLLIADDKKVPSTEQNISGITKNLVKDKSNEGIQKRGVSKEQERSSLKPKCTSRKILNRFERGLISKTEFGTRGHDSGSVAPFSGKVPFTSDYTDPKFHLPKNN